METLVHADIFFFISSIATVVLAAGVVVLLYYVLRLLRIFTEISEVVRDEAKLIKGDIDSARDTVHKNAEVVGTIIGAFVNGRGGGKTRRTHKKSK